MIERPEEFSTTPRPHLEYDPRYDLNRVSVLQDEERLTVDGPEKTLTVLAPPKGCKYNCDFCSIKHIKNEDFLVTPEAAEDVAQQINEVLQENPEADTVKLFNAGNVLYGTELGVTREEMHEHLWDVLPDSLPEHVKALEIEVRVDEFVEARSNPTRNAMKHILQERLAVLAERLRERGKELRIILPLEYVDSGILGDQGKFPSAFTNATDAPKRADQEAIAFAREHKIPWLSYAMLGGRLHDRSLTSEEATNAAANTAVFALEQGSREVIINSQYVDPLDHWEESHNRSGQWKDPINYFVPSRQDMLRTLELIAPHLNEKKRVRLTVDKEDIVLGTEGPQEIYDQQADESLKITSEFRTFIAEFNNAPDQKEYFEGRYKEFQPSHQG